MSKHLIAYYDEQDNLCFSGDYYYYDDLYQEELTALKQAEINTQEEIN